MAPIYSLVHQDRTPESPETAHKITSYISARTFFQLFAGTVCIFFFGVLLWKVGQFLRCLSRDRVVGDRKSKKTSPQYAKTWYGWVKLSRHEANKQAFRECGARLRRWTVWKSSRADYSWVWWDPGQREMRKYQEDRKALGWLPSFLRSYEVTPADAIWNPGDRSRNRRRDDADDPDVEAGIVSESRRMLFPGYVASSASGGLGPSSYRLSRPIIGSEPWSDGILGGRYSSVRRGKLPVYEPTTSFRGRISDHPRHLSLSSGNRSNPARRNMRRLVPRSISALYPGGDQTRLAEHRAFSCSSPEMDGHEVRRSTELTSHIDALRPARKYRSWSAQMQLQTCRLVCRREHASHGPPGSPACELLVSSASEDTRSAKAHHTIREKLAGTFGTTPISPSHGYSRLQDTDIEDEASSTQRYFPFTAMTFPLPKSKTRALFDTEDLLEPRNTPTCQTSKPDQRVIAHEQSSDPTLNSSRQSKQPLDKWETQLIECLDRKLKWFESEITPGQKPFHFPTLASHWLNKSCWEVSDPPSRISLDAQRLWGDPRFNAPYPEPAHCPRPKYPARWQRRTRVATIDSWRTLVNEQRMQAGNRDIIYSIEFDSSGDEPRDGTIDTASWLLRRPPQGFGMSKKQHNSFYGGGAGWQEKLDEWQRVRRGYRIRKAVYEGRANRTRARELAVGIGRSFRTLLSNMSKSRTLREEKCGSGA